MTIIIIYGFPVKINVTYGTTVNISGENTSLGFLHTDRKVLKK